VGLSGAFDEENAREVVERVGLTKRIDSKVSAYSHGMRQRLALAGARNFVIRRADRWAGS